MDDIFTQVDIEETNDDQNLNPVEQLVGDGKKFKSVEDLAKAKLESDRFIAKLQQELAELRQEVTKKATIDEILTQIKSAQAGNAQLERELSQAQEQGRPQVPQVPEVSGTPDLEAELEKLLSKKEQERQRKANAEIVSQKLQEAYGADATLHLNKRARELGVTVDYLKEIATQSPKLFFEVTGLNSNQQKLPQSVAPQSRVTPLPEGAGKRDRAYYERLKAQDRTKYFHPDTQLQLYKDMKAVLEAGGTW